MDAAYWSDVFSRLAALSRQWAGEHDKSQALFAALLDFRGRLVSLSADEPFAPLSGAHRSTLDAALPLLRAKHVRGLENILAALRKAGDRFKRVRAEMGDVHAAVWQRHATVASESAAQAAALDAPQWSTVGAGRGRDAQPVGLPAATTCIEWVRELDSLYAKELLLKLELLDGIDLGASDAALQGIVRLWNLQPNLTAAPATLERVDALAQSLSLPAEPLSLDADDAADCT